MSFLPQDVSPVAAKRLLFPVPGSWLRGVVWAQLRFARAALFRPSLQGTCLLLPPCPPQHIPLQINLRVG